jgi:hypothetical protein
MRGRLIQRFKAQIARLDTTATRSGGYYDDVFREVTMTDTDGDGIGEPQRQEHADDIVPCQVGSRAWEALQAHDLGNVPQTELILRFHFKDLERLSLVDATSGEALIHVGDRLVATLDYRTGEVVQAIRTPPGLYVQRADPSGWGISMSRPRRNLLRVTWNERSAA